MECCSKILIFVVFVTLFRRIDCQASVEFFDDDIVKYDCPTGCKCYLLDDFVGCTNQNLSEIPTPMYNQVQILDLGYNIFETIPIELTQYKQLIELSLSNNNIFHLTQQSLYMDSLQLLDLSSNKLTNWNKIIKSEENIILPPRITKLTFSHNQIGVIDKRPIMISSTLKQLHLEGCSLTNVSSGFLRNLTGLETLRIGQNKLKYITFSSESLLSLNVSRNFISYLPVDIFGKFPNLRMLDISYNHLRNLRLPVSRTIETLDLSYCNIEKMNISEIYNLKYLKLRGNNIGRINENYFVNEKLEHLDLSRNSIDWIDIKAFGRLKNLVSLDISMNLITNINPDTFLNNVNLINLDLSRNYLDVLDFRVMSLKVLDVSNCEIQVVYDKGLMMLPSLQRLYLSRNMISKIPDRIKLDHLEYLDLSSNRISSIKNTTFSYLLSLKTLNMRDNRFTSTFKTFYFPPSLSLIYLDDNLWHCNCFSRNFKQFYDYLVRPPSKVKDNYKLTCHSPENVSGHPWHLSCSYVWYSDIDQGRYDQMWLYVSILISVLTIIACVVMTMRKMAEIKAMREHTERERQVEEARERMRRLRIQNREDAQQNAPDPRELIRPPSYAEAILLPRIDSTSSNLNSNQSIEGTAGQKTQKTKKSKNKKRRRGNQSVENINEVEPKPEGSRPVANGSTNDRMRIGTDDSDSEVEESIRRLATKNDVITESNF